MVRGKENACMPFKNKIAAALLALVAFPVAASAAIRQYMPTRPAFTRTSNRDLPGA